MTPGCLECSPIEGWTCRQGDCEPICGDGRVIGDEACDTGDDMYCVTGCRTRSGACGDGAVQPVEGCDDGNLTDLDGCSSTCETEHGALCSQQDGNASKCQFSGLPPETPLTSLTEEQAYTFCEWRQVVVFGYPNDPN